MKNIGIFLIVLMFACNNRPEQSKDNKDIIGSWKLDGTLLNSSKQIESSLNEISFYEDGRYKQSIWSDDVGNDYNGRYFINYNPSRNYRTITLVPDLIINNKDTVLITNQNLDVFSISNNELVVLFPTEWIKKVDGQTYKINKKKIYKRK